jgi:hypothetical protein
LIPRVLIVDVSLLTNTRIKRIKRIKIKKSPEICYQEKSKERNQRREIKGEKSEDKNSEYIRINI